MRFLTINTDGTVTHDDPSAEDELETVQTRVGGYIQILPVQFHGCGIFLNEEGQMLDLDRNRLAEAVFNWPDMLLGNAVITGGTDEDLDTVGLSDQQLERIHEALRAYGVAVTE